MKNNNHKLFKEKEENHFEFLEKVKGFLSLALRFYHIKEKLDQFDYTEIIIIIGITKLKQILKVYNK